MSKTIKRCGDQGDIRLMKVDRVPEGAVSVPLEGGRAIVAHSETGHHHIVESPGASYFTSPKDPFTAYLSLAEDADLVHLRGFDTHEPIGLTSGVWMIRRQREYTPEGYRMVVD